MPSNAGARRVLELLWGHQQPGRRGPRPTLSRDRIVKAAVNIADTEGLEAMSMRRVAEDLGVGTASLYTYVPGKDELFALMVDGMIAMSRLPHEHPGGWREKVTAWAREDWQDYRAHPWVIQLTSARHLAGPGTLAWMNSALSVLEDTGLTEGEMLAAVNSVDAFVRGQAREAIQVAMERDEMRDGSEGGEGRSWQEVEEEFLRTHVDWNQYPSMLRIVETTGDADAEASFEFGLESLLDGIEARMRRRIGERAAAGETLDTRGT
ncbi:TetR/AcrR family transcriptional regulator C-terminal domain-containing protein [Spiractinospora alimapuensis]|uniref:TetR/AcrR family transcriptional regulator n=1 Tax=Spiractinospora alimapuensis TaxID=2820884 RepID=UPI001F2DE55C|nr:TetR/AcrR family transcriptional regulator [Spiractinospora alimapuensis]QVQ52989.1 TetR/AcrR family transcriptional regulator C-terminal domain-containing protein [Spiractinospora alimapuensis]